MLLLLSLLLSLFFIILCYDILLKKLTHERANEVFKPKSPYEHQSEYYE